MLNNFFKIAFRNLLKYKTYSIVNILGLAIGLASCIVILLYVNYELSYDRHLPDAENIYRVTTKGIVGENNFHMTLTPPPMAHTLVREFPEVKNAARIMRTENMLIRANNNTNIFIESNFFWADSTFFDVFQYNMIHGDVNNVLSNPHSVVLTARLAEKYFGKLDVVGQTLEFEDFTPYKITGVCENPPENSHFTFDILASLNSMEWVGSDFWLNNNFQTYLLLNANSDPLQLEEKFPSLIKKYIGPQIQGIIGTSLEKFYEDGGVYEYRLQALTDIHLHSNLDYEIEANGNITYVYIFSIIAIFILFIACINFMNLSTARAAVRAKEVGVKKVLGSNITRLIRQFLSESILVTALGMLLAIVLVYLVLPVFNEIAGKEFSFNLLSSWFVIPLLALTILIVGIVAGVYPAFYLSSFEPAKVLKTSLSSTGKGVKLRTALVVFQFAISIFLFASTLIVNNQLEYVQTKNLGWDKEHLLVIKRAWAIEDNEETFGNELLANPDILTYSPTGSIPGRGFGMNVVVKQGAPRTEQHLLSFMESKYDLDKTFNFEVKEGRYFRKDFSTDSNSVVVNESALRTLGIKDPLGKQLIFPGDSPENDYVVTIIGVLKDFHFESFHQKIRPLIITLHTRWPAFITLKLLPRNMEETLAHVRASWEKFVPDKPLEYFFMDDDFGRLYDEEVRTSRIFTAFSILAIFIACLGLFGLATFITLQRTKEIGIRKTLGASTASVVILLSKQFSIWVLLANILAWPAAYYFMNSWLNRFEYRVDVGFYSLFLAGFSALTIALFTVAYNSIKAALANPVKSLHYE